MGQHRRSQGSALSVHDITRGLQVLVSWLAPARAGGPAAPGDLPHPGAPEVLRPVMWPSFRRRWLAALNQRLLSRAVTSALEKDRREVNRRSSSVPCRSCRVCSVTTALSKTVYYCVDDFTQWHGIDGEAMRRMEKETLAACDLLIATSTPILESRGPLSRRSVLLTHGVDASHFARATPDPASPLATLPHPIVGMFGVFDRRIDADSADRRGPRPATATFAVVGPVVDRDPGEFRTRAEPPLPRRLPLRRPRRTGGPFRRVCSCRMCSMKPPVASTL